MIIQRRATSIRLFGQHEHGLVSGVMAHHWVRGGRLSPECIMAVALHDYAWVDEDASAHGSPDHAPRDFLTLPTAEKVALYRDGIDALERIHPYAALMVSHHYSPFVVADDPTDFRGTERARRARLGEALGVDPDGATVMADLDLLRLLDVFALYLPIAAPGSDVSSVPRWLTASPYLTRFDLKMGFDEDGALRITPSPFDVPFEVELPYRELPLPPLKRSASWQEVHAASQLTPWRVLVR